MLGKIAGILPAMKHCLTTLGAIVMCVTAVSAAPGPATKPSTAPAPPGIGEGAPDFILKSIDDKTIVLQEINAAGPVVLVVLRGWVGYDCPICTKQVAQLIAKKGQFADAKAKVLLIYPGPAENLKKHAQHFLQQPLPPNFELVLDPDFKFTDGYHIRWNAPNETAYPSTFVVNQAGIIQLAKVSKSHGGRATMREILGALKEQQP